MVTTLVPPKIEVTVIKPLGSGKINRTSPSNGLVIETELTDVMVRVASPYIMVPPPTAVIAGKYWRNVVTVLDISVYVVPVVKVWSVVSVATVPVTGPKMSIV
jgi:hypothetical protein